MLRSLMSKPEAGIIVVLLSLCMVIQLVNPSFMSWVNWSSILRSMALTGLVAGGLALCLISGTIDLSVGSTVGLTSVIFAKLTMSSMNLYVSVLLCMVLGLLVGGLNALIILKFRVTPFIATISTMYILRGLASFLCSGYTVYPLPRYITDFGAGMPLGLSWGFWTLCAVLITLSILLKSTVWGLCLRACGSDAEIAKCNEVDVPKTQASAITLAGGLAALAGVLTTMSLGSGVYTLGTGWELIAIAGCAIGGVSLFGYEGSMFGLFCGLLTIQVIQNGIIITGISPYVQTIVVGSVLLTSMIFDTRRRFYLNLGKI